MYRKVLGQTVFHDEVKLALNERQEVGQGNVIDVVAGGVYIL